MSVRLPGVHSFWGDLTKLAVTIASVDSFYLNLVICLQLDNALLIQKSAKIRHCLPGVMTMYTGALIFPQTQCTVAVA